MSKSFLVTFAVALALGVGLRAEIEPSPAPETRAETAGTRVHLEGCLLPEQGLSGTRSRFAPADPNATYILTESKVIAGPDDAVDAEGELKVQHDEPKQLRDLAGKRVGVTGDISDAKLSVVSIREIVGGCRRALAARS